MRTLMTALLLVLAGCASQPAAPRMQLPRIQLAPADFGATLSLAQRLTVQQLPEAAFDQQSMTEHVLDAQVEIEPAELRLAAFALNTRVLTLSWNGRELQQKRHPLLPSAVDASKVLRDVQLVYWPLRSVIAALPTEWSAEDGPNWRELRQGGEVRLRIDYAGQPRWQGRATLDNRLDGYKLQIESSRNAE